MRTYVAKGEEAEALKEGANWFVVDATDQVLAAGHQSGADVDRQG